MKASCSSFTCSSADDKHFIGRTYDEYGDISTNKVVIIPKNYEILLTFQTNESNRKQIVDYAIVGMNVSMLGTPLLTEGMNENGLMGTLLFFPHFAQFDTKKAVYNVNAGLLLPFVLGKSKNIEEAVQLMNDINVINELNTGLDLPCHYMFSDRSGESVVVEPLENGLKIYRSELGVLTNAPTYEWHKINLCNYLGTSNLARKPQKVVDDTIRELGEGSGYLGLPGDYTPVSRFVRLAFSKNFMPTPVDEMDAVNKMFNVFECVDVPEGAIYTPPEERTPYHEKTLCTSVMCAESLKYYFSTSTNCRVCCVDLSKELNNTSTELKEISIPFEQDILNLN